MKSKSIALSIMTLLIAMVSIQSGASLAKSLFVEVGPIGATTLRIGFAAIILLIVFRPYATTTIEDLKAIAFYGVSLGLMNLLFYLAIDRIPLGVAVALEFTGPLAIALYSSRKAMDFLYVILAAVGIYLVLPIATEIDLDVFGILCALGAGVFWAAYIVFGRKAGEGRRQGQVTAIGMVIAAITILPFGVAYSGSLLLNYSLFPIAIVVAILSSALPYTLEMFALQRLPQQTFGVLMSLEPAIAALSGIVWLSESLTLQQWLAITCIIVASGGSALSLRNASQQK